VSICPGVFLLAADLLDKRLATTCWVLTDPFQKLFSRAELGAAAIFVDHGDVLTSAGAASRADPSRAAAGVAGPRPCPGRLISAHTPSREAEGISARRDGREGGGGHAACLGLPEGLRWDACAERGFEHRALFPGPTQEGANAVRVRPLRECAAPWP
jgi:hypothetical protein